MSIEGVNDLLCVDFAVYKEDLANVEKVRCRGREYSLWQFEWHGEEALQLDGVLIVDMMRCTKLEEEERAKLFCKKLRSECGAARPYQANTYILVSTLLTVGTN